MINRKRLMPMFGVVSSERNARIGDGAAARPGSKDEGPRGWIPFDATR